MADTWYAVVDSAGNLVSTGTTIADADTLSAQGYSAITLSGDPSGQIWDTTTKTFGPRPVSPTVLTTWAWVQRFTAAEFAGIQSSTDPQVRQFLLMVQTSNTINTQDPIVQGGLNYLVALGLLTAARAAAVGAN